MPGELFISAYSDRNRDGDILFEITFKINEDVTDDILDVRLGYFSVGFDGFSRRNEAGAYVGDLRYNVAKQGKIIVEKPRFTVMFVDWNGDVLKTEKVPYGGAATAPSPDPSRTGYTFTGWDLPFNIITGDLVVTATYAVIGTDPQGWMIADMNGKPAPMIITLTRGKTVQFIALFNEETVTNNLNWVIDNTRFAIVSPTGLVTANKLYVGQVALLLFDTSNNLLTSIIIRIVA
jgi:hypothetical protein